MAEGCGGGVASDLRKAREEGGGLNRVTRRGPAKWAGAPDRRVSLALFFVVALPQRCCALVPLHGLSGVLADRAQCRCNSV